MPPAARQHARRLGQQLRPFAVSPKSLPGVLPSPRTRVSRDRRGARFYSRDPIDAEAEATTVRANRAARARAEAARGQTESQAGTQGTESGIASNGGGTGPNGDDRSQPLGSEFDLFSLRLALVRSLTSANRLAIVFTIAALLDTERLVTRWRNTPTRWYPIPVLLGAVVLLGVQARREYISERDGKGRGAKIVDENGEVVKVQGPWTVSVIVHGSRVSLEILRPRWGETLPERKAPRLHHNDLIQMTLP